MRRLKVWMLVGMFLGAVVAANLLTTHYGVSAVYYVAFGLIGLDLVTRDRLADFWGTQRWLKMGLLILAGGAISYYLNRDAATIAVASTIAFASSEAVEAVGYHLLRHQPWSARAPRAAILGAIVDSTVFISIAFGFSFQIVFLQVCCKIAGATLWTWLLGRAMPAPSVAPSGPVFVKAAEAVLSDRMIAEGKVGKL